MKEACGDESSIVEDEVDVNVLGDLNHLVHEGVGGEICAAGSELNRGVLSLELIE